MDNCNALMLCVMHIHFYVTGRFIFLYFLLSVQVSNGHGVNGMRWHHFALVDDTKVLDKATDVIAAIGHSCHVRGEQNIIGHLRDEMRRVSLKTWL